MSATLLRQLERAREELRGLIGSPASQAMAADPVRLFRATGLEPDPWQIAALRSRAPRLAFNVHRQGGKDQVAGTLACHTALYHPGAPVLVLSPSLRQSQEQFRRVLDVYRAAGRPVPPEAENRLSLELANGSRIVALPGKEATIRGFAGVRLLVINESARVPDPLYYAVRPTLAVSGGRLVTLSTPFGTRGWWYEAWRSDEPWERYEVPASACPRISPAFLEEERRTLGEWWYAQEYDCSFLDAQTQAFRRADIERAFDSEVEAWDLSA